MVIETDRLVIKTADTSFGVPLYRYLQKNIDFLQPWEPIRDSTYYFKDSIENRLLDQISAYENKKEINYYIFKKEHEYIIGTIGFSGIILGPFMSCFLGYKLDKDEINKGYMTEALSNAIAEVFYDFDLHRIEANVMPSNNASISVLVKLGFVYEGESKKYLKINGRWENHCHYVLLNETVE
jgi:ribosomal-protein-alanine N-acetyltransferase